jgi:hypothetical protein
MKTPQVSLRGHDLGPQKVELLVVLEAEQGQAHFHDQLLGDHGEHLDVDAVELVQARPGPLFDDPPRTASPSSGSRSGPSS